MSLKHFQFRFACAMLTIGIALVRAGIPKSNQDTIAAHNDSDNADLSTLQTLNGPLIDLYQACSINVVNSGTNLTAPSPFAPSNCRYNLKRPVDVCQARLDFLYFNMAGPNDDGDCTTDSFQVFGAGNFQKFVTCGKNTGQHLYLHYGYTSVITLNIDVQSLGANYLIQVTYLNCNTDEDSAGTVAVAPYGCTQYFTSTSEEVRSFNYQDAGSNQLQYQINNEQYTVCVETLPGTTEIQWTPCVSPSFSNPYANSFCITRSQGEPSLTGDTCITDFIDIPGSTNGRYCGCAFPGSVISSTKPYILYVNFNDEEQYGSNHPINPATGCTIGATCTYFGQEVTPGPPIIPMGAVWPCNSPFAPPGQWCTVPPFFEMNSDHANTGFCLKFNVM